MTKSKHGSKRKRHIKGLKGQRFTNEIRDLDLKKVMVVPIECAKDSHKALIANYFGDILVEEFEFENSILGIRKFHQITQIMAKKMDAQKIIIGPEATSHYYENMTYQLNGLGYNITLANPYSVWCQRQGQLNWCKTDSIDLCAIGQTLIDNQGLETRLSSGLYYNLRQAVRIRRGEVKKQSTLKNQIRALVDRIFPGLQKSEVFSDFWGKACLLLLEHYPTPQAVKFLGVKRLAKFLKKHNAKLDSETAQELVKLAKNALTRDLKDLEVHLFDLKIKLKDLERTTENIRLIEIEIAKYLVKTPGVLLLSIPYVNVVSAAEFVAEMGPIGNFNKASQVISLAGNEPGQNQTGTYELKSCPITKNGRSKLRLVIHLISQNLVSKENKGNPYFLRFFKHLTEERGKHERLAKTAVGNKFVRVAFAMMRDGKLFRPPTWEGECLTDSPLAKLEKFFKERKAGEVYSEISPFAKAQLPKEESPLKKPLREVEKAEEFNPHLLRITDGKTVIYANKPVHIGEILPQVLLKIPKTGKGPILKEELTKVPIPQN